MRGTRLKTVMALLLAGCMAAVLPGCMSEERKAQSVAAQEQQLEAMIAQANAWGADIIAELPEDNLQTVFPTDGGRRQSSDYYQEWPQYYFWQQMVDLKPDAGLTPEQLGDQLAPWLAAEGWQHNTERDMPPEKESFTRHYSRDSYSLAIEIYIDQPPRAQSVNFFIVTPRTTP